MGMNPEISLFLPLPQTVLSFFQTCYFFFAILLSNNVSESDAEVWREQVSWDANSVMTFPIKKRIDSELFILIERQPFIKWMAWSRMKMLWGWSTIGAGWSTDCVNSMLKAPKYAGIRNQVAPCFEMSLKEWKRDCTLSYCENER